MLTKAKRKAYMLSKHKNSRVTIGMTIYIWINIFDLSCFWAISIISTWIYWVDCSVTAPCMISSFSVRWPHFSVVGEIPSIVDEIMAGEIPPLLCDPVTLSYTGGKELSLMKSRENLWLISERFKWQMTSVLCQNNHSDGWDMLRRLHLFLSTCSVLNIYFSTSSEFLV